MRKVFNGILYSMYLICTVLLLLEVCYRYQFVEFYEPELRALNSSEQLKNLGAKGTLLIAGDSFTAYDLNYGKQIQDSLPEFNVINTAVVGFSIVEASYLVPKRIAKYNPDIFIYQIYVGNDLMGVRHNLNWHGASWMKNCYWWLSERIHVLTYLNYRAGQWKATFGTTPRNDRTLYERNFSAEHYRVREKSYAHEDPWMISDAVLLENGRDNDLNGLMIMFDEMIAGLKSDARVFILVIPHKAQVSWQYMIDMKTIGYRFNEKFKAHPGHYPFLKKLNAHVADLKNVQVLDVLPILRMNEAPDKPLYYQNDEHLNAEGHKFLSQLIVKEIKNPTSVHPAP